MCYRASIVTKTGKKGTTISKRGGIGLGYQLDGPGSEVVQSGGNGWYYPVEEGTEFVPDNGKGYMLAVRQMCGER